MPKRRPRPRPQAPAAVASLAARQHGVVSVRELYSLGLSDRQVRRQVAAGRLLEVHRGVFAVGYHPLTRRGEWIAALLAIGEGAALSHRSAAALWGIWGEGARNVVEVMLPRRHGRKRRRGIRVHRPEVLPPGELTEHEGLAVTSAARTVLDLATELRGRQLERAADEAVRLGHCLVGDLVAVAYLTRRPGSGRLRAVLRKHNVGSTATRNDFEEAFLALCRSRQLPQPEVNVPLLDYIVDFLWPEARLVVEVDGRATHGTDRAFQDDRDRDGRLAVAGYLVARFTWWDVTKRPGVVADRVRRLLRQRLPDSGRFIDRRG
jgi:very-short-patch-repair endonuclease